VKRAPNQAAPLLRRASELLLEQARTLAEVHSVGGVGVLFRDPARGASCRELRSLAHRLKQLSAAVGRATLTTRHKPVLKAR
jgi:hypothetical protein